MSASCSIDHRDLAGRFNAGPGRTLGVRLIGGAPEPVYLPSRGARPAWIRYARDHAASILHELAHWCLATPAERQFVDYGLVYRPPPRELSGQLAFYRAELSVQALEKLLCAACGVPFQISDDNPGRDFPSARAEFGRQVEYACRALCRAGPGPDATLVLGGLAPGWPGRVGEDLLLERCA